MLSMAFITPRIKAMDRNNRWFHNHRTPSEISARHLIVSAGASDGRNDPAIRRISAAANAKVPASTKKGTANPAAIRRPAHRRGR